jgi:hypothetical protein
MAQRLPEQRPIDLGHLHSNRLLNGEPVFVREFIGATSEAAAQKTEPLLKPGAARPIPILHRQIIAVILAVIYSTLPEY